MAAPTTGVQLFSLGWIADWIDKSITKMLTDVVTPLVASVTEKIMPVVGLGLSIALIWYGWLIMNGTIQTPILQATRKLVSIAVIVGIAGTGGLYQRQIAGVMLDLPTDVARIFTGTIKTPAQIMDDAANNGTEISTRLQERAPTGLKNIGKAFVFMLIALIITIISSIMSAIGMIVLITVKLGMGLVVVLGPLCILALLFEVTKDFFKFWLAQAAYYAIYAGLFMVVFMFIMGMFGKLQKGLLDTTNADQINVFGMLTALIFFMMCAQQMLAQVSMIASKITNGAGNGVSVPFLGKIG